MSGREYPTRPIPAVGVVIIRGEQVLLIRRGKPPNQGGWSLPGGGIEVGETTRDAARRELREELGIEVELRGIVEATDVIQRDGEGRVQYHYVIVDFLGVHPRGEIIPGDDVLDARWAPAGELDLFDLPEFTRKVIRQAYAIAEKESY